MSIEIWDLLNRNKMPVGLTIKRGERIPKGYYHLVVHAWIVNKDGLILMSQRQENRPYALLWERTGGSVLSGEDSLTGAMREVREELGLDLQSENKLLIKTVRREKFRDFYDSWLFIINGTPTLQLQQQEVKSAKWMTVAEIDKLKRNHQLVKSSMYYPEVYAIFRRYMKL